MRVFARLICGFLLAACPLVDGELQAQCGDRLETEPAEPSSVVRVAFSEGDSQSALSGWTAHTDNHLGGSSQSSIVRGFTGPGNEGVFDLRGSTKSGFAQPFAGANLIFTEQQRDHAAGATVLEFCVRGDGNEYLAQVLTDVVKDFNEFSCRFRSKRDQWSLVKIQISDCKQSEWWGEQVDWSGEGIRGIAFQTVSRHSGAFELSLYKLELR